MRSLFCQAMWPGLILAFLAVPRGISAESGPAPAAARPPEARITEDEETHRLCQEGVRLALNWDLKESRERFDAILKREPDSPAGDFFLAALSLNTVQYLDSSKAAEEEERILRHFELAIAKADRILRARPDDFPALFFKGAAHGFRGILRLQKGQFLAAASDARIGKEFMDLSVKRRPDFHDAYLGTGLYNYFVDALPAVIKVIKMILRVPAGDRAKGLEQLTLASERGTYASIYAKVCLAGIYRNFEENIAKTLQLEMELANLVPDHPWYALERGTMFTHVLVDYRKAEETYLGVLKRSRDGHPHFQGEIPLFARWRLAEVRFLNLKPAEAIRDVEEILALDPQDPKEILPACHLLLGRIYVELGDARQARIHLLKVREFPDSRDYRHARMDNRVVIQKQLGLHALAGQFLDRPVVAERAEAYRGCVEGWAALRSGQRIEARAAFERVLKTRKGVGLAQFGLAECLAREGKAAEALAQLDPMDRHNAICPRWFDREVPFRRGLLLDRIGRREDAIRAYDEVLAEKKGNYFTLLAAERSRQDPLAWKAIGWPEL